MALISIIVPVFNIQDYIGECLNSLMTQNIAEDEYEVIVVDDGSTDNSGEIIDSYAQEHSNIRAFHKANGGVSSARNLALTKACGEYVWFVDGDDCVVPNVLQEMQVAIVNNQYPDLLKIRVKSFEDGEPLPDLDSDYSAKYDEWMFTRIYKKDIIDKYGITFDEDVVLGEDDIFCVFCDQHIHTMAKLNKVGYFYRQRKGSALHSVITDDNFEKYAKSAAADLKYFNEYEFFWYKKDSVYKFMPNMMLFSAQKPHKQSKKLLRILKNYHLYPLKVYKTENSEQSKISGFKRIRQISYTRLGYRLLRLYLTVKNEI